MTKRRKTLDSQTFDDNDDTGLLAWEGFQWRSCGHNFSFHLPGTNYWLGSVLGADTRPRVQVLFGLGEVIDAPSWPMQIYLPWADGTGLTREITNKLECFGDLTSMGLFCTAGHGRTGTAAAYLLGRRAQLAGTPYPDVATLVTYLRSIYCKNAVETQAQIDSLARLLALPVGASVVSSRLSYWASKTDTGG